MFGGSSLTTPVNLPVLVLQDLSMRLDTTMGNP